MKKIKATLILLFTVLLISGCSKPLTAYEQTFYQTFDTAIRYLSYTESEADFQEEYNLVKSEMERLHKLYDNFNSYEDIENVMSLNQKAGQGPIKVEEDLYNVIKFSVDNYEKTNKRVNIAMGRLVKLWNDARLHNVVSTIEVDQVHSEIPEDERILPSQEAIAQASQHSNMEDIILDEDAMTVELKDPEMLLDLGSVAKGYATELVAQKLIDRGVKHASINAGGNVRMIGTPGDGREKWGLAIQNPDFTSSDFLEVLFIADGSVVTSGDYQRYFEKDGTRYHHIIDPDTHYPGGDYSSVSIVTENSGLADYLSTVMFLSTKDEAYEILDRFEEEIGVLWYSETTALESTDNIKQYMRSEGAKSDK